MRFIFVLIYLFVMIYFIVRGLYFAFIPMLIIALGFICYLPVHKENIIRATKKKLIEAQKKKQQGQIIKPFIEINSSPWYVLAELPGISVDMAKRAVQLRKENGPYPCLDVFLSVLNIKHVYLEHIRAVAYVKNEVPPINKKPT